jgi:hypothetical protein
MVRGEGAAEVAAEQRNVDGGEGGGSPDDSMSRKERRI